MGVLKLTSENFEQEVLKSDGKILVDFYADWCGPCKTMSPIIDEIAEEGNDVLKVGKVNVDEASEIAEKYGIMSIPTIMVFEKGETIKTFVGVTDKSDIINALK